MADNKLIELVSSHFHLGNLISDPVLINSGISQCFKIQTEQGKFFIKLIDAKIFHENYYVSKEDLLFSFNLSEKIAKIMSEKQIPCISAIDHLNGSILQSDNLFILVYPYVDGYVVNQENISPAHIEKIANNLANIHQLSLNDFDDKSVQKKWMIQIDSICKIISFNSWVKLSGSDAVPKYIQNKLIDLMPFLYQSSENVKSKFLTCKDILITHNDIKPKNVLWDQFNNPILIDWESAGYMEKSVEFLETLLSWCLEKHDQQLNLNELKAKMFVKFYPDRVNITLNTINLVAIKWISWLSLCAKYLLRDEVQLDPSHIVNNSLEMLYFLRENKNTLLSIS